MSGIGDAASAVTTQPVESIFPAIGYITEMTIVRSNGTGPIVSIQNARVRISGETYVCGASGAFMAEISAAGVGFSTDSSGGLAITLAATDFIGRQVKVESIGGLLLIAYTTNWS